jgi:uracil-DNA glycosylase
VQKKEPHPAGLWRLPDSPQRVKIVQSAHPWPLSAKNGFFGSKPFSRINKALREADKPEIDWQIPDL